MKDTVAEVVAGQAASMIVQLRAMGLRKESILRGLELCVERERAKVD